MSDLPGIEYLPGNNAQDVYLEDHDVFATLTPCDAQTWQAFSNVVDWAQRLPADLGRPLVHLRLHKTEAKQPLDSLLASKPQHPTDQLVWHGCYAFSLTSPPRHRPLGWTAGYGPQNLLSGRRSTGANWPDLILGIGPSTKKENDLNHSMVRFNFSPEQSASFTIYGLLPDTVRVNGRVLQQHE